MLASLGDSLAFISVDTEALKELVLENTLMHEFLASLPELELYLDYMDKRVTKCKDAWLKFFRTYHTGTFGRIANKIKERDARRGSMNPDDYQDPLCSDLLALLVYSRISNELFEFLTEDLKDTDRLGTLH